MVGRRGMEKCCFRPPDFTDIVNVATVMQKTILSVMCRTKSVVNGRRSADMHTC